MNSKNHKGFTLIEAIFSIMLLGVLGTSIFMAQASILRTISVSHLNVSTCLYMHNALTLFRIQLNYSKNNMPSVLQEALSNLQVQKDEMKDEKFSGQKLCTLVVTQMKTNAPYSSKQELSYFYYDTTPKDEKNGSK